MTFMLTLSVEPVEIRAVTGGAEVAGFEVVVASQQ